MASLSECLLEFAEVMERIEEKGGEITDDLLPTITHAEIALGDKIDRYVTFHDNVIAQKERTKSLLNKFKIHFQMLENLEARLKSNVKYLMQAHDLLALQGHERNIKLQNAGGVQATNKPEDMFFNEECVAEKYHFELHDYLEEKTVYVIKDKSKFQEAIKNNKFHSIYLLPRGKYVKFN